MISTVRSSKDFVDYDLRHTLGFVANPRRFNGKHLSNPTAVLLNPERSSNLLLPQSL
jgi:hypothetical protein